jgi:SM-20-related protein
MMNVEASIKRDSTLGHNPGLQLSGGPAVVLDEFLVAEEWARLIQFTLSNTRAFGRSEVVRADGKSGVDREHRLSRVLFNLGPLERVFRDRLRSVLPYALARLGMDPFKVSNLEIQLTGTNHNEYFRPHVDDTSGTLGRRLTFVYFFHREPRRFGGGELRIFDAETVPEPATSAPSFRLVYPLQNQLAIFPSTCLHEILPVICPSQQFADSRFTVNGWYHQ